MKKTIEVPDFEVRPKLHPEDEMKVYIRKDKILFRVGIDQTGNDFEVDRGYLENLLKHSQLSRKANLK